ncbi:hypothetical protein EYZ11_004757 [Aspergillus tanneri]|uniref:Uncharacterized protein n=1 Tax=Aspergillus tanneri TaxID=1220188 RepID=A0A4S3JK94_9EURO|nr:hypothetical protein EYZ11_004757 [Aspergillus tanneri]
MSSLADPPSRNTGISGVTDAPGKTRKLPVLSSSVPSSSAPSTSDPMDVSPPTSAAATGAAAPIHSSPDSDRAGANNTAASNGSAETGNLNNHATPNQAIGAAAAAQQPKVVQTAFIHKLYKYYSTSDIVVQYQ